MVTIANHGAELAYLDGFSTVPEVIPSQLDTSLDFAGPLPINLAWFAPYFFDRGTWHDGSETDNLTRSDFEL